jgi:heat shock protein HslJ
MRPSRVTEVTSSPVLPVSKHDTLSAVLVLVAAALAACTPSSPRADSARARPPSSDARGVASAPDSASGASAARPDTLGAATPLRARGNEPGWSLEIGAREITVVADYGERRVVVPTPAPVREGDTTRYASRARGHDVAVAIVDALCHDGMSGIAYPRTVTVTLDGRELRGCGGEAAEALQGGAWTVDSIGGAPVAGGSHPTLEFGADGRVSGNASCNRFSGHYALHGEEISFSRLVSTRMACAAPEANAQETRFLRLLEAVRRYELRTAGRLALHPADDRTIIARR